MMTPDGEASLGVMSPSKVSRKIIKLTGATLHLGVSMLQMSTALLASGPLVFAVYSNTQWRL